MEPFVQTNLDDEPSLFVLQRWMEQNPALKVGISSRLGGVSKGEMASLNCALHVNDNHGDVIRNRLKLTKAIGFPFDAWTCAEQVHSDRIKVVTPSERGRGRESRTDAIQTTDGLITNCGDIVLTAFFADCVPLFFWDPIANAIGLSHAGWKGTVLQIAEATVESMEKHFGSKRHNIHAAIGPSIGSCCYEVDDLVMDKVQAVVPKPVENNTMDGWDHINYYEKKDKGKYMLDLKQLNRQFMIKAGILPTNIEVTTLCTSCNSHLFFSHRKEQGKTGRMAAWIGLSEG